MTRCTTTGSNSWDATQPNQTAVRGLTGDEALPRLRTYPETTDIPVMDLSTDAKPSQKAHLLQADVQAFLTKPIDVNEFLDTSTPSPPTHAPVAAPASQT